MLVDPINNRRPTGATENTVLGPFHVNDAPRCPMGTNITPHGGRETRLFEGVVRDLDGSPIEGAQIDVWSDSEYGFYDVQQTDIQPRHNNHGVFTTGPDGRYWLSGIKPVSYPIRDDGPVGQLLGHLGRHPNRPAHIHFILSAPGYDRVTTHTSDDGDLFITSDAVFGAMALLITEFEPLADAEILRRPVYDFIFHRTD